MGLLCLVGRSLEILDTGIRHVHDVHFTKGIWHLVNSNTDEILSTALLGGFL